MSERKVLSKYYPPDFDPSQLRRQKKGPSSVVKLQTVRLMAPFSMKCTTCGEYIYKGRKFNSRKEAPPDERYLGIQIFFFHIKCTRCSAEITFRTDPKNNDYAMVRGALRNMEPWRNRNADETDAERLDRLEMEEMEEDQNADDPMQSLEQKTQDAQHEIAVADALDRIRMENAARARKSLQDIDAPVDTAVQALQEEQDRIDAEEARRAFEKHKIGSELEVIEEVDLSQTDSTNNDTAHAASQPPPVRRAPKKKKKDYAAALGIKAKKS